MPYQYVREPLTAEEADRLANACDTPTEKLVVWTLLDTGLRVGELRLFPAVRAEPGETIIAATGVSCRQQIVHGTGRSARHPLEIIQQVLLPSSGRVSPGNSARSLTQGRSWDRPSRLGFLCAR